MQLVAASRMRKAQENAEKGKAYARKIWEIMLGLSGRFGGELHPFLDPNFAKSPVVLVVVFSPQRGLAGSLPGNLSRRVFGLIDELVKQGAEYQIVTIGKKVRDQIRRRRLSIAADFSDMPELPTTGDIRPIVRLITEEYLGGQVGRVVLVYPRFISSLVQEPTVEELLPLNVDRLGMDTVPVATSDEVRVDFIYEPDRELILNELVPSYLETQVYQAKLDTVAAEYSARMLAMRSATTNAEEIQDVLTLEYNKSRQDQITRELAEISAGRMGS